MFLMDKEETFRVQCFVRSVRKLTLMAVMLYHTALLVIRTGRVY